jgi:hypothetical protein
MSSGGRGQPSLWRLVVLACGASQGSAVFALVSALREHPSDCLSICGGVPEGASSVHERPPGAAPLGVSGRMGPPDWSAQRLSGLGCRPHVGWNALKPTAARFVGWFLGQGDGLRRWGSGAGPGDLGPRPGAPPAPALLGPLHDPTVFVHVVLSPEAPDAIEGRLIS